MPYTPDPDELDRWYRLGPAERWRESCWLRALYDALPPGQQRALLRGDDDLAPGEFRWRFSHYLGRAMPETGEP